MRNLILIILFILSITIDISAQLKITGEIRPRFEFRNGYKTISDSSKIPTFFVNQRTRINIQYKKEKINTKISFQDARVWGDQKSRTHKASIGLHEAWAEYLFNDKFSIKAGRQEIAYENKRFLSNVDWNTVGVAHDALTLKYHTDGVKIDLCGSFNQSTENIFGTDYTALNDNFKTLAFLGIAKKINEKITLISLSISDGYQKANTTNTIYQRATTGLIFNYKSEVLDASARAFYQMGKTKTGNDIESYYLNPEIKYKMFPDLSVKFGMEYMSGNDMMNIDGKEHAFDVLYGTRHRFNGAMDYYGTPSQTKGAGLKDIFLNLYFNLAENYNLNLEYHNFTLQNNYVVNNEVIDKYLGSEVDLYLVHKVNDEFSIETGYALMFPTESSESIKGGDYKYIGHFGYIMLTFKPVFFKN